MYLNTAHLLAARLALFARGGSNAFQYFAATVLYLPPEHAGDLSRERF